MSGPTDPPYDIAGPLPLKGVKVVELGVWIAGPAAAGMLADWGADVIKVEPPGGDPQRHVLKSLGLGDARLPPFEVDNRGKRSIVLDLKTDDGRDDMAKLLDDADVFITNLRLPALRDLGIDPDAVRRRWPSIVYGLVTGFGSRGPDAERAAYDVAGFWARSGAANAFTTRGGSPPGLPASFGDHLTATSLVAGVNAALVARAATGEGRLVETSLLRTGMYTVAADLSLHLQNGKSGRALDRSEASQPLVNSYRCADGAFLWLILLETDRHWPKLVTALGRPELAADERFATAAARFGNRRALIAELDASFAARSRDGWAAILDEHDVWWAPQHDADAVLSDPQVLAANGVVGLPGSAALPATSTIATPVDFDGEPTRVARACPTIDEHGDELRRQYGLTQSGSASK